MELVNLNTMVSKEWESAVLPGRVEYHIYMCDSWTERSPSLPHRYRTVKVAISDNGKLYAAKGSLNYYKHGIRSTKNINLYDLPNKYLKALTELFRHINEKGGTIFGGSFSLSSTVQGRTEIESIYTGATGVTFVEISLYID